jgi:hypothetical protein
MTYEDMLELNGLALKEALLHVGHPESWVNAKVNEVMQEAFEHAFFRGWQPKTSVEANMEPRSGSEVESPAGPVVEPTSGSEVESPAGPVVELPAGPEGESPVGPVVEPTSGSEPLGVPDPPMPAEVPDPPGPVEVPDPSRPVEEPDLPQRGEAVMTYERLLDELIAEGVFDRPGHGPGLRDAGDAALEANKAGWVNGILPLRVDVVVYEHRDQAKVLDALGLRGQGIQGAHLTPQSVRSSPDPDVDKMLKEITGRDRLVIALPAAAHTAFDAPWKRDLIAARRAGETTMSVEDLRAVLHHSIDVRAASANDAERAARERDTLKWIVDMELRHTMRLDSDDVVNLPYENIKAVPEPSPPEPALPVKLPDLSAPVDAVMTSEQMRDERIAERVLDAPDHGPVLRNAGDVSRGSEELHSGRKGWRDDNDG